MESLLTEPVKPAARKFSVDEYYRMAEAGILRQKERVELLDGQILCMAPIGDSHQDLVDTLSEILGDQRNNHYRVRAGGPIRIEHFNEPQPDIVLYKRGVKKHPSPGEIYLVVEVSDTLVSCPCSRFAFFRVFRGHPSPFFGSISARLAAFAWPWPDNVDPGPRSV